MTGSTLFRQNVDEVQSRGDGDTHRLISDDELVRASAAELKELLDDLAGRPLNVVAVPGLMGAEARRRDSHCSAGCPHFERPPSWCV